MLPKLVKDKIEERFGRTISNSIDCHELTIELNEKCGEDIDAGDIRQLFGIERHFDKEILTVTYDAIARYIGYPYWSAIPHIEIEAPEITANVVEIRTYWNSISSVIFILRNTFWISLVVALITFVGYSQCNKKTKHSNRAYFHYSRYIIS